MYNLNERYGIIKTELINFLEKNNYEIDIVDDTIIASSDLLNVSLTIVHNFIIFSIKTEWVDKLKFNYDKENFFKILNNLNEKAIFLNTYIKENENSELYLSHTYTFSWYFDERVLKEVLFNIKEDIEQITFKLLPFLKIWY